MEHFLFSVCLRERGGGERVGDGGERDSEVGGWVERGWRQRGFVEWGC